MTVAVECAHSHMQERNAHAARETFIFLIAVATYMRTIMKPQQNTSWAHSRMKSLTRDVKRQDTTLADLQACHVSAQHPHLIQLIAFPRGR